MRPCPENKSLQSRMIEGTKTLMMTKPQVVIFSFVLAQACFAELFTLRNGTVLDGEILRETADSFVLDVKVSRSIRDEKTVKKSDVVKREKSDPSKEIYESKIEPLAAVPDFSNAAEYDRRLKVIGEFLDDYSSAEFGKKAKELKAKLEGEAKEVRDGAIKYQGEMIPADRYKQNRYEVDARAAAARVTRWLGTGQFVAALRDYGKMGKNFVNTVPYCELAPTMKRAASTYLAQVSALDQSFEMRMEKRQNGLSQMSVNDRGKTEAAIADEKAQFEKRYQKEKEMRVGWISIDPDHRESLKDTLNFGKQEEERLARIPVSPTPDAGEAYRKLTRLIAQNANRDVISQAVSEAKSAKIPDSYVVPLAEAARPAQADSPKPTLDEDAEKK